MNLKTRLVAGLAAACVLAPSAAMAWTKSYVVEWFEEAFHYGGPETGIEDAPGTDCPLGANDLNVRKELTVPYRTKEKIDFVMNPENGIGPIIGTFGFRGPNAENIYQNPTSVPDPGIKEMEGKVAMGFDLDNNPNTGFDGLNGEKGVDNAYYKAAGCIRRWRGPPKTSHAGAFHMEIMRAGRFSVVMVVSGKGSDPMNDDNVTVGIYNSQDRLVKDANGVIAEDYTYRVAPDPRFQTVFKARIRDGVIEETDRIPLLHTHDTMQGPNDNPVMELEKARVRFVTKKDGTLEGYIGGYRDWYTLFRNPMGNSGHGAENGSGQGEGAIAERLSKFNAVGFYYALRRRADGLPDPVTGANRGISVAYHYWLRPAFVVSPKADEAVVVARNFAE